MKAEALRLWNEYIMHTEQGITYAQMGYVLPDGQLPAWKIDEHKLIDGFASQAQRDKKRADEAKARARRGRR